MRAVGTKHHEHGAVSCQEQDLHRFVGQLPTPGREIVTEM
jgi:hypothetical protein